MTLTPFWHRRICEAIAVFCLLIIGLYAWSTFVGISDISTRFYVSPLAAGISAGAIILAALSYFVIPEAYRSRTAHAAYWILLFAIGTLIVTTGAGDSPFIATWMIAVIFAGLFGPMTLAILAIAINLYMAYLFLQGQATNTTLLNFILAGELPVLVSYILWHGKSSTEKTKERAYFDLANELDQVSSKAEVVINAISDGVIAVGTQGQIELINPAAQRIVGWGHQDALNLDYKSVLQLLSKDGHELEKSVDPVVHVLSTNQPIRRDDLLVQTSSGKKIMIELVVSPIGQLGSGAIIVFGDITKEKAEENAQAEFISTASHEMRTPVASIEGYLGLALNPATANIDAKARDFITKAHASAKHLGRLFQDLLDVTKADDGRMQNNPKVIDVVQFVNEIIEGLQPKATEKNLRLFFKPVGGDMTGPRTLEPVFYVNVDDDHLREVMSNLVENGIKYTLSGEVVIDVKGDDQHVVISITDSGIGIPAEDIPHLFQKFYRVDNSDTREIGGTGLGLYLCRRLIENMGGRIWVDSEYKKGSTFSVELDRISHEEATHMIEAANTENALRGTMQGKAVIAADYKEEGPTDEQKAAALATPIIMKHETPAGLSKPAVTPAVATTIKPATASIQPAPAAPPANVDPLMGTGQTAQAAEPLHPHTGMVLPPDLQAIKSNFQSAAAAKLGTPAPVAAPAPKPTTVTPAAARVQAATPPTPAVAPIAAAAPTPAPVPTAPATPAAAPATPTPTPPKPAPTATSISGIKPIALPPPVIPIPGQTPSMPTTAANDQVPVTDRLPANMSAFESVSQPKPQAPPVGAGARPALAVPDRQIT